MSEPNWSKETWHPSEDELLCYVDGELNAAEKQQVKLHLEACWACRVRGEEIQAEIASFVRLMEHALSKGDDLPAPPSGWRGFEAKLSRVMLERQRPSLLSRWFSWCRDAVPRIYLPFRLVGGAALVLAVVFAAFRFHRTPSVSASQVLQKAVEAEAQEVRSPTQPVVYQKLQVRRKARSPLRDNVITLETWNDSSTGRFAQRVLDAQSPQLSHVPLGQLATENSASGSSSGLAGDQQPQTGLSPLLRELGDIFRTNGIDGRRPLSPKNYESWRKGVTLETEGVEETNLSGGVKGLVLSTTATGPFSANAIVQASLVIRTEDWHAVAEALRIQGEQGIHDYELTETGFDLLALNKLPGVFPSVPPSFIEVPRPTSASSPANAGASGLVAAEMMARYALHQLKACLGEPVEIVATDHHIEVRGLAEGSERKQELTAALRAIPRVMVKIQTLAEAQAAVKPSHTVSDSTAGPAAEAASHDSPITVKSGKLAIQEALERYFNQGGVELAPGQESVNRSDTGQRIIALSSQAVSLADSALADGFALRQLAERYRSAKTPPLEASSRWLLEVMIREHLQSLKSAAVRSRALLEPVLRSLETINGKADPPGDEKLPPAPDWPSQTLRLFGAVAQMERLTAFLFAGRNLPEEEGDTAAGKLLAVFGRIERESSLLAEHAGRTRREGSDPATLAQRP